jgi:hypothetical protein
MRDLVLEEKTGFYSTMPFTVYEPDGKIFYSSDFVDKIANGKKHEFNLPAGIYKYDGSFIKLDRPVPVKNIALPQKERNIIRKRYNIEFGDNPNKCTIFYAKGLILFDNSFKNKPLYIKYAIYYHELGHHFYKTEAKADLYAAKMMLDKGFNPSQIGMASINTLSNNSFDRKMKTVNSLTKNFG